MQPRDGRAGLAQLEARLEAFREYGELVRAQEAAVDAGDIDEVRRLSDLRDALQARLDVGDLAPRPVEEMVREAAANAEESGEDPAPPTLVVEDGGVTLREQAERRAEALQAETYRVLIDTAQAHERLTERLQELRGETREDVQGMGRRQTGIRSYVGRKVDAKSGLNIRF